MTTDSDDSSSTYVALVNEEGQYSLWPDFKAVPAGWTIAKTACSRQECLDYIKEVWTDLRPLSLRRKMETAAT